GLVTSPTHDCGENISRCMRWIPLREYDRLPVRLPVVASLRNDISQTLTVTEMDVVSINPPAKIHFSPCKLYLGKDRIGVDINKPSDLSIIIGKFQRTRHVQEHIGAIYDVPAFTVRQTIPLVTDGKAIRPSAFEAEPCHERIEISYIFAAVMGD